MSDIKSKEEILDFWYETGMHWKASNRYNILKAMDEYAKQQSIEFSGWLNTNHYIYNRPSKKYLDESYLAYEPSDLYQDFIDHQLKQQV